MQHTGKELQTASLVNMKRFIFGVFVALAAFSSTTHGYQCTERPRMFGCFSDSDSRRLMKYQFSRSMTLADWSGEGWNLHLQKLLCECSKAAKEEGTRFFGLENYYECWTGNLDNVINIENLRANNTKCWSENPNFFECKPAKQHCVGTAWYMEIYEVTSNSFVIPETEEPTLKTMTLPQDGKRPPPQIPTRPPQEP